MTEVYSWGHYPNAPQTPHTVHWRSEIPVSLNEVVDSHGLTLPFGNGRSYGDSCMAASDHVLRLRPLDRLIAADWKTGVIAAEAGISLGEILALAIPRGWFLAVAPGTQFATLGGAIANDVHGKNHHRRGTFGCHVKRFSLRRRGEALVCSPSEQPHLFVATIGGLGLTGVIEWAEIQLLKIRSSSIESTTARFGTLSEFFVLSRELDSQYEYSAAWIDCLSKDGRGALIVGNHALNDELRVEQPSKREVPITPRWSLINGLTTRAFNEIVWRSYPTDRAIHYGGYSSILFPLDGIVNWNRVYGRKGFQQYQCVIPEAAAEAAIRDLLAATAKAGQGSCLAVLKRCGTTPSPGLLSFPMAGTSLALDFPQSRRLESDLFPRLDAIVREAGGRLYPAKDAHMTGADFRKAYPAWEQIEGLREPALNSKFWQRVTQ